jgi:dipeptidyl aminopeptidase/acylaminoacyl peptidase
MIGWPIRAQPAFSRSPYMHSPFVRLARRIAAVLLASTAIASHAQAPQPRPSIESFFGNVPFSKPVFSPNGKLLALTIGAPGKRDGLAVIDLSTMKIYPAAGFPDADVGTVHWVNNHRLVFNTADKLLAQGDLQYGAGLYAVNYDGKEFRQLAETTAERSRMSKVQQKMLPWNTYLMDRPGAQDSDSVYVEQEIYGLGGDVSVTNLVLLNTVGGTASNIDQPPHARSWLLDNKGAPRLAIGRDEGQDIIYVRDPLVAGWKKLGTFNTFTGSKGAFTPLAFGPDGTLYVEAHGSTDKEEVRTLDMATGKLSDKALIALDGYDFSGRLIVGKDKLLGFRALTDTNATYWFDAGMKAVQAEVDARLGSTVNLVTVPTRPETPWVLVQAYSDVQPTIILLYNTQTKAFSKIGETRPAIKPATMGHTEMVRYKARDGLEIPGWLTLPPGGKRDQLPLVVLVHGGPFLRGGSWGWDAERQFLATRGYAVLEPEFRGSTGFGSKHFRAGWKQWGLAMQDDIADGAKWAIAQGIADPARICIAGASYGGYAALMGLINDPALYKCAVNWVGVTDIELMYTGSWLAGNDLPPAWKKYGMPELIGDRVKDAAQLKATSPLQQAARVTQPLLLAYGGADERVPLHHGDKFYNAVKKTNPNVEWVVYPDEGHGWALPETNIDFWSRVEKFLDRHIGKP